MSATTLPVTLRVNGAEHALVLEPRVTLLDALRDRIGLTGAKKACDMGECGACTVLADGRAVYACMLLAVDCAGREITTIEGLGAAGELDAVQRAFIDADAFQCGFCTPGQILSLRALLDANPSPADDEVRRAVSGNLCRCGAYANILKAGRGGAGGADGHPRLEGPEKVGGRASYAADVRPPGLLYARVLRSPYPHARIRRLDASRAEALPGVRAVLSRENAPPLPWYGDSFLFDDTLRFVGDEVAAVAADTADIAEDALRLVQVEYEPLPFVTDLESALRPDAPRVREGGNIAGAAQRYERGDPDAGLAGADVVIDRVYRTETAVHNALEPHGCTATWAPEGLTVRESTQAIFDVRQQLAAALGLPEHRVRVISEHMGGGFGAKQIAWKHAVIAALLSRAACRPVQLVLDREAESLAVGNRGATRQHVRLGARRDGTLTAILVRGEQAVGAYRVGGEGSSVTAIFERLYRCPNVRTEQVDIFTNTGPAVAFRAPGHVEGAFALESAMDELARALDLDPLELRLRNYAEQDQKKDRPYSSPTALRRCYERAAEAFGWRENRPPAASGVKRRGVGMAAHDWAGGGWPPAYAWVKRNDDGTADVVTGTQDIGTGTRTGLAQIAAEELGLPLDRVRLHLGDTATGPYAPVSAGSATQASVGPAVRAAAADARAGGRPGRGERGPNPKDVAVRTFGVQFVEVEVDTETGEITVLRVVASHECGRVVNPTLVDSQVAGGVVQGLGYALLESRAVDAASGVVLNANLEEYKLPTAADTPAIEHALLDLPDLAANPTGAKGIGEPPIVPTAPAIANAIHDAVGVRLRTLPITRDVLLEALAGARPDAAPEAGE